MHISTQSLKKIIKNNGLDIKSVLKKAGVSKTAYYSLVKKESVLPGSILAIAKVLQVKPTAFLENESASERKMKRGLKKLENIMKKYPCHERENIWHTLLLLQEKPIERLRRGLRRGQKLNLYQ